MNKKFLFFFNLESCVADPDCAVEDDYENTNQLSSETNVASDDNKVIDKKLLKVLNYLLKKNKQQQRQQQQLDASFDKK